LKLRFLMLVFGTLLPCLLLAPLALNDWWVDGGHLLYSTVAAVLCLVPSAATLVWCDMVLGKTPEQQLAAVLGGTVVRMAVVISVGLVLFNGIPEVFGSNAFWLWIIGFYLWTLTVEMAIVLRRQPSLDQASHPNTPA
jgi:hypothetical protein